MVFNVGDFVRVVNKGYGYPLYKEWVEDNCPKYLEHWKEGKELKNGDTGTILHIAPHMSGRDTLHLVRSGGSVYVMGETSIELINSFTVELI